VSCSITGHIFNRVISSKAESDVKEVPSRGYHSQTNRLVHIEPDGTAGTITFVSARSGVDTDPNHEQAMPVEGKTYPVNLAAAPDKTAIIASTNVPSNESEVIRGDRFATLVHESNNSLVSGSVNAWQLLDSGLSVIGVDEVASVRVPALSCDGPSGSDSKVLFGCHAVAPDSDGFLLELQSELALDSTNALSSSRSTFTWSRTTVSTAPTPDTEIVLFEQHQCSVEASQIRQ
jgi:hypothetical protein